MSVVDDVRKVFERLPEVFVPEKAANLKATAQIELSGEGASSWIIKIENGVLNVEEGQVSTPDLTLQMAAQDYLALTQGKADPMTLFGSGRIKLQGNMALALKFPQIFNRSNNL